MPNKERIFYIFLALLIAVMLVFIYADKIWSTIDDTVMPLVNTGDDKAVPGSGSADPAWIDKLDIHWDNGNVFIRYAPQDRITWLETFTQGAPTPTNILYYWMNTKTLFIHYRTQGYDDRYQKADLSIQKDLYVFVPQDLVLSDIVVRAAPGTVTCEVKALKSTY